MEKTERKNAQSLLTETRALLRRYGLQARKRLGQRFLIDTEVLGQVVSAAELAPDDVIMEVGPGLGVLTQELVRQAGWVIAIELDDNLAAILKQSLSSFRNVTVINEDILNIAPGALLRRQWAEARPGIIPLDYKVVANLPYYITSPVLRHFLEAEQKPRRMVVMVQREVAEAIAASPGEMSLLSVCVQFYGRPKIVSYVPALSFYPVPEVDSAILRIDLNSGPAVAVEEKSFFALVRAGFSAPRKQILNSLAQGLELSKAEVQSLLEKSSVASQRRAETLSLEEWARLWQALRGKSKYADSKGSGKNQFDP